MAALTTHLSQINRYPLPDYLALRQILGQHHGLDPEWVLPGNGAAELLTWIGRDLACLEATYLFTPAFGDYRRSLKAFDAQIMDCPLSLERVETGQLDWATTLIQNLESDPGSCGLLLNTPHNPTGLLIPLETLQGWLQQFALVVVDEAFMDFLPPTRQTSVLSLVTQFPNLVVLRSLTKFYSLPGLRLGYAVAQPGRLQRWQQWRDPWPVNTLAEVAAIAALQDTAYQQSVWQWLPPCRDALIQQLQVFPEFSVLPGQANYLLIKTHYPGPTLQLELLKKHHIFIRDCMSFTELGEHYIRIAIRHQADNQRLAQAMHETLDTRGFTLQLHPNCP